MPDKYRSHEVDPACVDECFERPLAETPTSIIRVKDVVLQLQAAGMRVFMAGGTPRDWLSRATNRDVDISINCPIGQCHAVLRAAFPGVDPVLIKIDSFGLLRWGSQEHGTVDISILRSPDALVKGQSIAQTVFGPGNCIYADSLMGDFSVNSFYYDCALRQILEPQEGSLVDLQGKKLRLISDPRKLAVDFRISLRIAQFVCRGYEPVESTLQYLEQNADRDVMGVAPMFKGWVQEHLSHAEVRNRFRSYLAQYLRDPRSHEELHKATEEGSATPALWSPPGPQNPAESAS